MLWLLFFYYETFVWEIMMLESGLTIYHDLNTYIHIYIYMYSAWETFKFIEWKRIKITEHIEKYRYCPSQVQCSTIVFWWDQEKKYNNNFWSFNHCWVATIMITQSSQISRIVSHTLEKAGSWWYNKKWWEKRKVGSR